MKNSILLRLTFLALLSSTLSACGKNQKDNQAIEDAKKALEKASIQAEGAVRDAKTQFGQAVEKAQDVADDVGQKVQEQADAAAELAQEVTEEVKDSIKH